MPTATAAPACAHHWRIEMPSGPTSTGRCTRCGEEREFKNSAEDYGAYGSYKECGICGRSLPYTRRYFARKGGGVLLTNHCLRCNKERVR